MGKSKSSNQLFITSSEWKKDFGGFKRAQGATFAKLPFSSCSLSFLPWVHPTATAAGVVYDLLNIVPWIKKHGTDPASGDPLAVSQLIRLHFTKDETGKEYICPITLKTFNDYSHIVALKTTGNVFSFDAVDRLNIKTKHWKDLLDDTPFKRSDIITIQDPSDLRDINSFYYRRMNIAPEKALKNAPVGGGSNASIQRIMNDLDSAATPSFVSKGSTGKTKFSGVSSSAASMSLTYTGTDVATSNVGAELSEEAFMLENIGKNKKAVAIVRTNVGEMEFSLFCSETPWTCYNFISLAKRGDYQNCKIHRLIPRFMFQTGDTNGKGGQSIYGKEFKDEFHSKITHSERGMLCMANHGINTNSSQFFVTFKDCRHLDRKHSVFGKIRSGLQVLDVIEQIPTDSGDAPTLDLILKDIIIIDDPFDEFKRLQEKKKNIGKKSDDVAVHQKVERDATQGAAAEIGKYLGQRKRSDTHEHREADSYLSKKQKKTGGFGNFDGW